MTNPILALMQKNASNAGVMVNSQQSNSAMGVINMIRGAKNPNAMIQQLASSNPIVANTMNLVNQYGGNPQKAFYEEVKKRGIDPNQIFGMLK